MFVLLFKLYCSLNVESHRLDATDKLLDLFATWNILEKLPKDKSRRLVVRFLNSALTEDGNRKFDDRLSGLVRYLTPGDDLSFKCLRFLLRYGPSENIYEQITMPSVLDRLTTQETVSLFAGESEIITRLVFDKPNIMAKAMFYKPGISKETKLDIFMGLTDSARYLLDDVVKNASLGGAILARIPVEEFTHEEAEGKALAVGSLSLRGRYSLHQGLVKAEAHDLAKSVYSTLILEADRIIDEGDMSHKYWLEASAIKFEQENRRAE